jgi:WD40 repeat protein
MGEATGEPERILVPEGFNHAVTCLSVSEGRLISGYHRGMLRVWNVVTGKCEQVIDSNSSSVYALAVCGSRLACGSANRSVRVWAMVAGGAWSFEKTLLGHAGPVWSLAIWRGKVLSGSEDMSIRAWDAGSGAHDATLTGHDDAVCGLAVHGDRLFSASGDRTIRVWALGTWVALQTVEAWACETGRYPRCLAVSGSKLVCGSCSIGSNGVKLFNGSGGSQGELRVWGLEALELQHTLPQPVSLGANIRDLLAMEGGVWAGVGRDVVVWERGA